MREIPQDRQQTCACCWKLFRAVAFKAKRYLRIVVPSKMSIPIDEEGIWQYPKFCPMCRDLIEEVEWFEHHRKDPRPKLLQRELRKKMTELEKLLESS